MNFRQLEAFYWLSQIQSYRQTAERLGLTQPAVSARIKSLEVELGKTLIDRDAAGFQLTEHGIEVAEFALQFLDLRETMNIRLLDKRKVRLAVGLAGTASLTWGPVFLQRVRQEFPDMVLDVFSGSSLQINRFVNAGTLDLAFTASKVWAPGTTFAVRYDMGWVARPDIIANVPQPLTQKALTSLPIVLYPKTSPIWNPMAELIDKVPDAPAPRHYGNSLPAMCEMLRLGYGASALALSAVENDLDSGKVIRIPVTEEIAPLDIGCTFANLARRKQVNLLMDVIRDVAATWCRDTSKFATFVDLDA